jgi:hypothetical protein
LLHDPFLFSLQFVIILSQFPFLTRASSESERVSVINCCIVQHTGIPYRNNSPIRPKMESVSAVELIKVSKLEYNKLYINKLVSKNLRHSNIHFFFFFGLIYGCIYKQYSLLHQLFQFVQHIPQRMLPQYRFRRGSY